MRTNVIGRVKNTYLPKTRALLPLFEAVVNSVDAIEDSGQELDDGRIEIRILRRSTLAFPPDQESGESPRDPIWGFEIEDNGIGFDEQNYQAFNEADTLSKASRGGKGVGRFIWLRAFEKVEVDSSFFDNGKMTRRVFTFSLASPDGITDHAVETDSDLEDRRTIVSLLGFKEEYEEQTPRTASTIAQRLVEHCLEYFILGNMPTLTLHDPAEEDPILLDDVYEALVSGSQLISINVQGHTFDILHFFLHAHANLKHHISYCANHRVVQTENIGTRIPNLPPALSGVNDGELFIYAGYVSSEYLDDHVNQQRTGFGGMPANGFSFPGELAWEEIVEQVLSSSREILQPYTETVRAEKEKRIRDYVSNHAPEYRHIVRNYPERLDAIPPGLSDEGLDRQLYELERTIEMNLRQEADELLNVGLSVEDERFLEEQWERFSEFWQEWNEAGKAKLAKYIVHRKRMLTFLEKALKRQRTGGYSREEAIHQIIFPLRTTSEDVTYDQHNLWIIDEKLAYHQYLASDIPLRQVESLEVDSLSRPDLLMFFDRAVAVVDEESPYTSGIVIFEFKRPMRDDYSAEVNPIQQVFGYVDEIKRGKALDKDGRPLYVPESTPFYCYIVGDLTEKLINQARFHSLTRTPDGRGFFGYNKEVGAYVEILDFDKLLQDSKKRNRVLFDKLGLPDRV